MTIAISGMASVFVPDEVAALRPWVDAGVLGAPEVHAAAVIARNLSSHGALFADERIVLAFALAVWAPRHGHACIDLESVAATVAETVAMEAAAAGDHHPGDEMPPPPLSWPEPRAWRRSLRDSSLVRVVDAPEPAPVLDDHPLVLHGWRLYTQRQWVDEGVVAATLRRRAALPAIAPAAAATALLDVLLHPAPHDVHTQHAAASAALTSKLAVVVGGPGTGKTHTVACLLAALVAGQPDGRPLRIGLAAPTGKAAARMSEAVAAVGSGALTGVELPDATRGQISELRAVTVHRLLGPRGDHRTRFRHTAHDPVPYDVVVVDEASMVALPLMARLLEALPDECRLVLVGDPDQLTSIEAGAVLGDVVRAAEPSSSPLHGNVVRLNTQHRVGVSSPIGPLAEAVRRGRPDDVVRLLGAGDEHERLRFLDVDDDASASSWPSPATLAAVRDIVGGPFAAARHSAGAGDHQAAIDRAGSVRVLCAHRRGPAGASDWNAHVQSWLFDGPPPRRDYSGRVVLATRNDPRTGIVNGEPGVFVRVPGPDGDAGPLRVAFRRGDAIRLFSPAELDELDTAFAMTIHKSQGSEYETVVVVHPPSDSPLISRELLYTAVTRSRRNLVIVGSEASIRKAVETPTRRITGLTSALR